MDGGPITAVRTAAVSGAAIRHFAPAVTGRPIRAALIGAGVQGRSHLPVLGGVLPGVEVSLYDPSAERLESLAELGRETEGVGAVHIAASAREAIADADVVVTAAAFGPLRQVLTNDWLDAGRAGRAGRLRHVLLRRGRPRRRPVPDRPSRPARRGPGERTVRRLPGADDDPRRGLRRRGQRGRPTAGSWRCTWASAWPMSCSVRRSSSGPRRWAWAWSCRADEPLPGAPPGPPDGANRPLPLHCTPTSRPARGRSRPFIGRPPPLVTRPHARRAADEPDGFRPDLEGLRAVAVVLVLLYHASVPGMTGGYVGVDVFFVLSGFLITGLLLREVRRTGTISLSNFYARRARRLLPASALVLRGDGHRLGDVHAAVAGAGCRRRCGIRGPVRLEHPLRTPGDRLPAGGAGAVADPPFLVAERRGAVLHLLAGDRPARRPPRSRPRVRPLDRAGRRAASSSPRSRSASG